MIVHHVVNFDDWKNQARLMLSAEISPDEVNWVDVSEAQSSLLLELSSEQAKPVKTHLVPAAYIKLAQLISCHRDSSKWAKLYLLLWRITHGEKNLLAIAVDPLMHELLMMEKSLRRDKHKMKAFVRFKKIANLDSGDHFVAWYKPDHKIVRLVAPFFQRRFEVMQWTILTPDECVSWEGRKLSYSPGMPEPVNISDELENLWQTYYAAIFNPARIKIAAMKREMPVRFWNNLPETKMIPKMLQESETRVAAMIKHTEGFAESAKNYLPEILTFPNLKSAAEVCKGCHLYQEATQTVFGEGNKQAKLMLVGEQPGQQEDLQGHPFVGPAGKLLHATLEKLGIDHAEIYFTNAVKHFKFEKIKNFRQHRSPNIREVHACKPWLASEINVIKPQRILCLGLTAAKALISPGFQIKKQRGIWFDQENFKIAATYHPSAILRAFSPESKTEMLNALEADLVAAVS